jgi:N-acetylmuramoyl-L-alanine amidase
MRRGALQVAQRLSFAVFVVTVVLLACYGLVRMVMPGRADSDPPLAGQTPTPAETNTPAPPSPTPQPVETPVPTEPPTDTPDPTPSPPDRRKIGIVAGHWQSDSGAVCEDGFQEVWINLDIASRVVAILQYEGYDAELLAEYEARLAGYQADAFLSIHADSCDVPEASGFKVARVAASAIPEEEDRLVECLALHYAEGTGLQFHRDSITFDMTDYHAFWEIDPSTPAAIIELGFMGADRELLTEKAYEVAQAIARGLSCFLGPTERAP